MSIQICIRKKIRNKKIVKIFSSYINDIKMILMILIILKWINYEYEWVMYILYFLHEFYIINFKSFFQRNFILIQKVLKQMKYNFYFISFKSNLV